MGFDRRLLVEPHATRRLSLAVGIGLAAALVVVTQAFFLSRAIDGVFLRGLGLGDVTALLWGLVALAVLRAALAWASDVVAQTLASGVKSALRSALTHHLVELGPLHARGERSGELAQTLSEGVEALDAYLAQYLPQLILAAGIPLLVLVAVAPRDPISGIILFLTAPLIPVFMALIGKWARLLNEKQWLELRRMSAHFLDVLQGLPTLRLFGRSRDELARVERISERYRHATLEVLKVAFLSALVLELVATLSVAIVAVGVGLRLLYGRLDFAAALFVLLLAPEFYQPLRRLGASYHAGLAGRTAAQRIFEILATPLPEKRTAEPLAVPEEPLTLALDRVEFAYDQGEPTRPAHGPPSATKRPLSGRMNEDDQESPPLAALRDLSFTLAPGETVALVGPSGAGKTTVLRLILGFARPLAGTLTVNGIDLARLEPEAWRRKVAWVPQRPHLFHGTVADNLRLARPAASDEEVLRAARLAEADEFIRALPAGYDTSVGERGARLSGGQAQRLALARAFLKDAPIVLLDEPTAHLDAALEERLAGALERLAENRSVLMVAHRLRTVERADRILVLDGGALVEAGSHAELMAGNGLYPRLWTAGGGA